MRSNRLVCTLASALGLFASSAAHAQCAPIWDTTYDGAGALQTRSGAALVFAEYDDDGDGEKTLYAGGSFFLGNTFTGLIRWNGADWEMVGGGLNSFVNDLLVFDDDHDGPNPARLFVAGNFLTVDYLTNPRTVRSLATWDGFQFDDVGGSSDGGEIMDIELFDPDADGPAQTALYAAGFFVSIGGVSADRIAAWDGATWSPLGDGTDLDVLAMQAFDEDGPGPIPSRLWVTGDFVVAGGLNASHIAIWDGLAWSTVPGGGVSGGGAWPMFLHDPDGDGIDSLLVGGSFTAIGGIAAERIARYEQGTWSEVGGGLAVVAPGGGNIAIPYAFTTFDADGPGPLGSQLIVAGHFDSAGGVPLLNIAAWDGANWSALAGGLDGYVRDLYVLDSGVTGNAPILLAAGYFEPFAQFPARSLMPAWVGCATPPPSCPGDIDSDGDTDLSDLGVVLANFGLTGQDPDDGDTDGDGDVDLSDLGVVLANFGVPCE